MLVLQLSRTQLNGFHSPAIHVSDELRNVTEDLAELAGER
jgi:hypothetical protein